MSNILRYKYENDRVYEIQKESENENRVRGWEWGIKWHQSIELPNEYRLNENYRMLIRNLDVLYTGTCDVFWNGKSKEEEAKWDHIPKGKFDEDMRWIFKGEGIMMECIIIMHSWVAYLLWLNFSSTWDKGSSMSASVDVC